MKQAVGIEAGQTRGWTRLVGRGALLLAFAILPVGIADRYLAAQVNSQVELRLRQLLAREKPPRDVILGSSHAAHGIDPRRLAGDTFENFGMDGAGSGYLLRLYGLMRLQGPPTRAIVVASPFMLRHHPTGRRLEHDAEHLDFRSILELAADPSTQLNTLFFNRFAFFKHRSSLLAGLPQADRRAPDWHTRGFFPYSGQHGGPWAPLAAARQPYDAAEAARFAALLDALRRDGVRVAVVQVPLYRPMADLRPAEDARLVAIATARGMPVLGYPADPTCPIGDDRADFFDADHLGARGAARFSDRLSRDLLRLGFLQAPSR